jgi:hypothetical protein
MKRSSCGQPIKFRLLGSFVEEKKKKNMNSSVLDLLAVSAVYSQKFIETKSEMSDKSEIRTHAP